MHHRERFDVFVPPAGLHPSAPMRSPVSTGCSAACRSRDSCPTCLSSRSGLQPSFPVRPICCLRLSAWSASLALPTTWPTMPSADFCPAVRPPYGALSRRSDTEQISWGKFSRLPCIVAGSTLRILDGYGLRGTWPARPTLAPSTRCLSIDSHVCYTLPSDLASRRQPLRCR